jgi:plasmid segregation protein ParM
MKLGVDPGKYGTKGVTKDASGHWQYFYVRSKIQRDPVSVVGGQNYLINYKGEVHLIGEAAADYSLDTDKQSLQHKLCTYIAVSQLAHEEPCQVVIGCPFNLFKNAEKREQYESYMKDDGLITFKVNEEDALINMESILAFPECGGIAYSEPEEDFAETERAVIDIGGLNVNACIFENFVPVPGSDFTVNLGFIILKNKLKDELNKQFIQNLQDHDITAIIKKGLYIDGKRVDAADKVINKTLGEHFETIIQVAKKHNWSVRTLDITIGGGGALDLGNNIFKYIHSICCVIYSKKMTS